MPYTVWSRGRLLGHSGLSHARCFPRIRTGDFEPTRVGLSLMPILSGIGPAIEALVEILGDDAETADEPTEEPQGGADCVRLTTEYADALSISDQLENLALELRDAEGKRMPVSLIGIQDTEQLSALARENGVILIDEADDLEEWLPRPSRYQILVELEADDDVRNSRPPPWALSPE